MLRGIVLSLLAVLSLSSGCGLVFFPTGDPNAVPNDSNTPDSNIPVFPGKVYLIGQLQGSLIEELGVSFPNMVAYDGTSTDAPILIDANAADEVNDTIVAGILATYQAGHPIVLIHATSLDIDGMYQHVLNTSFQHELALGYSRAEVYGLDLEAGGDVYVLEQYPPTDSEDYADNSPYQQRRVGTLVDWLKQDGSREDAVRTDAARQAVKVAAISSGDSSADHDLLTLAKGFSKQLVFGECGNNYQTSFYIYSCHSLTSGDDWFYVDQKCVLNSSGAYAGKTTEWRGSIGAETQAWYLGEVEMNNYMSGYLGQATIVDLERATPETANNKEEIVSGIEFDIGGELSFSQEGPHAGVTTGIHIKNEKTITVHDCTVTNKSNDKGNNAHWVYQFKRCMPIAYFAYGGITDPTDLSIHTFQPDNQWIWRMTPVVRQNNAKMHVSLKTTLIQTKTYPLFFWSVEKIDTPKSGGALECDIDLVYPAISAQP